MVRRTRLGNSKHTDTSGNQNDVRDLIGRRRRNRSVAYPAFSSRQNLSDLLTANPCE